MLEPLEINNKTVTAARTKKIKEKNNRSCKLQIDKETSNLIEQLNMQIDRECAEARRGAMTYVVI